MSRNNDKVLVQTWVPYWLGEKLKEEAERRMTSQASILRELIIERYEVTEVGVEES